MPSADILANADPNDSVSHQSSLGDYAASLGCTGDCIAGRPNMIPRGLAVHTDANGNLTSVTGFVGGVGRFGLRANGVEILQFIIGGLQGELSLRSLINNATCRRPTTRGPGERWVAAARFRLSASNVNYGASAAEVICPAYGSAVSKANRSDAREVIRRFRALSPQDQAALIAFLKQL